MHFNKIDNFFALDNAMELRSFVFQGFAGDTGISKISSNQAMKIFRCSWSDFVIEFNFDAASLPK
jgi:hypothetical protein